MSKSSYIGVSDIAQAVGTIYVGVDGVAQRVRKGYVGDENGVAQLCWIWGTGGGTEIPDDGGGDTGGGNEGEDLPILAAPMISLDGDTLSIYDESGLAEEFDILVDGETAATVQGLGAVLFTIYDLTYLADPGMTWADWCDSEYNVDGYYCGEFEQWGVIYEGVLNKTGTLCVFRKGDYEGVSYDDRIGSNASYYLADPMSN